MATTATAPSSLTPHTSHLAPWYLSAVVLASVSVITGLIWDISWHRTIGRDTFWTPAHMAIYLGGVLAGCSSGWLVLKTTFAGTVGERAASVSFWGFRGPLGAWVCIWGSFAMLTSAPFDNWWHDAYGLDVTILSPPHAVLGMGIAGIQIGAILLTLAAQNRSLGLGTGGLGPTATPQSPIPNPQSLSWLFIISAGILVTMHAVMTMEYNFTNQMHSAPFYRIAGIVFPIVLVAAGRAGRVRYPAATTAAVYMGVLLVMIWLLQLFPAEPGLAPITHPVDRMVPPHFPLLLVAPAFAIDLLLRRFEKRNDWLLAVILGAAFVGILLAVQWFFADFLLSPAARNPVFAAGQWGYNEGPGDWYYRYWAEGTSGDLLKGLGVAHLIAAVSSRIGLWMGAWMTRVHR